MSFEIVQKIWFDRSDLHVSRVDRFDPGGAVMSDARYSDWQPGGELSYPREIEVERPSEDYRLAIHVNKLTLNETVAPEQFRLKQPAGSDLVRIAEDGTETKEPAKKEPQP
jgi:outer membrane lipoprotein-sorting protein